MGYERHHAIVVSSWNEDRVVNARHKAGAIGCQVSDIVKSAINDHTSFLIAPDGSKEGWDESYEGDKRRDKFVTWLDTQRHEDSSSMYKWVEVQYGDDERVTKVVRHSDQKKYYKGTEIE